MYIKWNILLLFATSPAVYSFRLFLRVDDSFSLYADGKLKGFGNNQKTVYFEDIPDDTTLLAIVAKNDNNDEAGIAVQSNHIWTDLDQFGWKCSDKYDSSWSKPSAQAYNWTLNGIETMVIWTTTIKWNDFIYCRAYLDECRSSPCQNWGQCIDGAAEFTCDCSGTGYEGITCEDVDECSSAPCQNNATCINTGGSFNCDCSQRYTGKLCETDVDECLSFPCENNATCINTDGSFTCNCSTSPGYEGNLCEQDVDECLSSPCEHDASCSNTVGSFNCDCSTATGFTGQFCQMLLPQVGADDDGSSPVLPIVICSVLFILIIAAVVIALLIVRKRRKAAESDGSKTNPTYGTPENPYYNQGESSVRYDNPSQHDYLDFDSTPTYAGVETVIPADMNRTDEHEYSLEMPVKQGASAETRPVYDIPKSIMAKPEGSGSKWTAPHVNSGKGTNKGNNLTNSENTNETKEKDNDNSYYSVLTTLKDEKPANYKATDPLGMNSGKMNQENGIGLKEDKPADIYLDVLPEKHVGNNRKATDNDGSKNGRHAQPEPNFKVVEEQPDKSTGKVRNHKAGRRSQADVRRTRDEYYNMVELLDKPAGKPNADALHTVENELYEVSAEAGDQSQRENTTGREGGAGTKKVTDEDPDRMITGKEQGQEEDEYYNTAGPFIQSAVRRDSGDLEMAENELYQD